MVPRRKKEKSQKMQSPEEGEKSKTRRARVWEEEFKGAGRRGKSVGFSVSEWSGGLFQGGGGLGWGEKGGRRRRREELGMARKGGDIRGREIKKTCSKKKPGRGKRHQEPRDPGLFPPPYVVEEKKIGMGERGGKSVTSNKQRNRVGGGSGGKNCDLNETVVNYW